MFATVTRFRRRFGFFGQVSSVDLMTRDGQIIRRVPIRGKLFVNDVCDNKSIRLVDDDSQQPYWGSYYHRLYINFDKYGITPVDQYCLWLGSDDIPRSELKSGDYVCQSNMVDDWFTYVDNFKLTMLSIHSSNGLTMSNSHMVRL